MDHSVTGGNDTPAAYQGYRPGKTSRNVSDLWQSVGVTLARRQPCCSLSEPSAATFSRPAAFNVVEPSNMARHMNKDELDGKTDALKGRVKQGVGDLG